MGKREEMPIDPRGIPILANSTIRSWVEALVELLTNSDDSYKRLENKGLNTSGEIKLFLARKKKGKWESLAVLDSAEGISRKDLDKVTSFFADTNEYVKNKNIRGFFGRGLKETIVALGIGDIITIKDEKLNIVKIWQDSKTKKTYRQFIIEDEKVTLEIRKKYKIKKNGTLIDIEVHNNKLILPELKTLEVQLKNHISLRDIFSSKKRCVQLIFEDLKREITSELKIEYEFPESKKVFDKKLKVPGYEGKVELRVYETKEKLEYKNLFPFNTGGILIKTGGAILDNRLFKFGYDSAAHYFYGECISFKIDSILRNGDPSILTPSRTGIEWNHDYAELLMKTIERELEPLIEEKKKELAKNKKIGVNKCSQKLFKELSKLANNIYDEELGEGNIELEPDDLFDKKIFIKPEMVYIPSGNQRTLCVYSHEDIVKRNREMVNICSIKKKVFVLNEKIYLEKHKKYPHMFIGKFKVMGLHTGDEDVIEATLGEERALCEVRVKESGKKSKSKKSLKSSRKGSITGFEPDLEPTPVQRAYHDIRTGKIIIYTQFPGISTYVGEFLENIDTEKGRILLCEIVGEAIFRKIAKEQLAKGEAIIFGESDADAYLNLIDELQKKHLNKVYNLVINYDFEKENG